MFANTNRHRTLRLILVVIGLCLSLFAGNSQSDGITLNKDTDFATADSVVQLHKHLTEEEVLAALGSHPAEEPYFSGMRKDGILKGAQKSIQDYSVGKIPVQSGVSSSGGKTYSIPIETAAGWNFVPSLSISYDSQSGNGVAGYGWNIGGLSSISVRNKNYYYDGTDQLVLYNSSPEYQLDGIPIVQADEIVSGGYIKSTVRGNIMIRPVRNGTAIAYFLALYPDGTRAVYGDMDNTGWQRSYPLTSISDRNGNTITFSYSLDGGIYYPDSVTYGEDATILFTYTTRTDYSPVQYVNGTQVVYPKKLLTKVSTKDGEDEICRYEFTHESQDGVKVLTELRMSSGDASLPPLAFVYGYERSPKTDNTLNITGTSYLVEYLKTLQTDKLISKRGRIVPGATSDALISHRDKKQYTRTGYRWYGLHRYDVYGSGFSANDTIICTPRVMESSTQVKMNTGSGFQRIDAVDVDGDGNDELVKINFGTASGDTTTYNISVYSFNRYGNMSSRTFSVKVGDADSNSHFSNPPQSGYHYGDFRGNGRQMLLITTRSNSHFALVDLASGVKVGEQAGLFSLDDDSERLIVAADLENDGKTDLCYLTSSGLDVYAVPTISGSAFYYRRTYSGISKHEAWVNHNFTIDGVHPEVPATLHLTDINGDGLTDIVSEIDSPYDYGDGDILPSDLWHFFTFTGTGFVKSSNTLLSRTEGDSAIFLDMDRDGLSDLVQLHGQNLYCFHNYNGTFNSASYVTASFDTGAQLLPCSINRNNSQEELIAIKSFVVRSFAHGTDHLNNRLLRGVDLGGFDEEDTAYGYLDGNDGAYLTDYSRTYSSQTGFARRMFRLPVVKRVTGWEFHELISDRSYVYYDAVFNGRGLGFCGFGKTRSRENFTGRYTDTRMDPEKFGSVTRVDELASLTATSPFLTTVNTYDNHSTTYGKLSPRLTSTTVYDNLHGRTTTSSYSYDSYGYPLAVKTRASLPEGYPRIDSTKFTYSHRREPSCYILGSVTSRSVRSDMDGDETLSWMNRDEYVYDALMRPVTRKEYVGRYGRIGSIPVDSTAVVSEVRTTYDSMGNILALQTFSFGATESLDVSYSYDGDGRYMTSGTDEYGKVTTYDSYTKWGKPCTVTYDNRLQRTIQYNAWGEMVKTTNPDGSCDSTSKAWEGESVYTVFKKFADGSEEKSHYDGRGREVRRSDRRFDGSWRHIDMQYDSLGNIKKVSLPFKETPSLWTTYHYDAYDRPTSVVEPSSRTTTWTYSDVCTTVTKDGIETTRATDAGGNLVSVSDPGGVITYTYRDDGQISSMKAPGNVVTSLSYDRYGRRKSIDDPSAGLRTSTYTNNTDGTSSLTNTSSTGSVTTGYDKWGRVSYVNRSGAHSTQYVYDNSGLLISMVSSNGTLRTMSYDSLDRLISVKDTINGGISLKRDYTYHPGGNIASVSYTTQDGPVTTENYSYGYGHTACISFTGGGDIWTLVQENGLGQTTRGRTFQSTREYAFNQYGFPTMRSINGGSSMYVEYQFDPLTGNLLLREDGPDYGPESFSYDSLNRLVGSRDSNISYQANGNITSIVPTVGTMSYDDPDRPYTMTSFTPVSTLPVPADSLQVSYTSFDMPSSIVQGATHADFVYGVDGDRTGMTVIRGSDTLLVRHYVGARYEVDDSPSGRTERLYIGCDAYSAPLVYTRNGSSSWSAHILGRDYLGSIVSVCDDGGNIEAWYRYDPWGRAYNAYTRAPADSTLLLGRGFTGHEHLPWFGLINMNARIYSPIYGRFLSPDPYIQAPDFTQNLNRYVYALNNPLKYSDESGEYAGWDDLIVALVGGSLNWAVNGCKFSWEGLAYFGIGAASGVASLYISPVVSSGFAAGANNIVRQGFGGGETWNWNNINFAQAAYASVMGGATTYLGGVLSSSLSGPLGYLTSKIPGKAWAGLINRSLTGTVSGAVVGFGTSALNQLARYRNGEDFDWDEIWSATKESAAFGGALGAISGMAEGVIEARMVRENPWTGRSDIIEQYGEGNYSVYVGSDPVTGAVKYVGMTGRDPQLRWDEHLASGTERSSLHYKVVSSGFSKQGARVLEQTLINHYGIDNLYNRVNSISPQYWEKYNIKP